MRPQILLVSLALFLAAVSATEVHLHRLHGGTAVGAWKPIKDLKDLVVVEVATFAVSKHNEQAKSHLKLERIVKGDTQVVAQGTRYRLILAGGQSDFGGREERYEAIVSRKLHQRRWEMELTSFKLLVQ